MNLAVILRFLAKSYGFIKISCWILVFVHDFLRIPIILLRCLIESFHFLKISYNFLKPKVPKKWLTYAELVVLQALRPLAILPSHFATRILTILKIYSDLLLNLAILLRCLIRSYSFIKMSYQIIVCIYGFLSTPIICSRFLVKSYCVTKIAY